MNIEETKALLLLVPMMRAFADGKTIQHRPYSHCSWEDLKYPSWGGKPDDYRVKPEPREFYINIYDDGCRYLHTSEEDALHTDLLRESGDCVVTIKVREVVE